MAKLEGRITKPILDKWTYKDGRNIRDGRLGGFFVEVYPSDAKTFFFDYVNKYKKRCTYRIGRYGDVTLEQARNKATELAARISLEGYDPLEEEAKNAKALDVNGLLDLYFKSAKFAQKAASTQKTDIGKMDSHIRPLIGKRKLEVLTPDAMRGVYNSIANGDTAKVTKSNKARGVHNIRGGDGAARNVMRVLRAIFNWAIEQSYMTENPAGKIKLSGDGVREAALQTTEDYERLFNALASLESTLQLHTAQANAIRLLALTGARRNEIAACKWKYVDMERGIITLPPKTHKSGHGANAKAKELPLPSAALAILAGLNRGEPDAFVFSTDGGNTHVQLGSKVWAKIRKEGDLPEGINNHALRHSLGTLLAIQGAESAQIMAALGHSQLSTTQRYINLARDARSQLLERHTAGIAAALGGSTQKAEVIELHKGRKA